MDKRFLSTLQTPEPREDRDDDGQFERDLFEAARAFAERVGFDEAIRIAAEGAEMASKTKGRRYEH